MKGGKPTISIVVPAFNEENYLPRCLQTLKNQDYEKEVEIIVVNNNSTDKTEEIAKSFKTRVVREAKQGLIFAKQAGCDHARGKIIAVLDADNLVPRWWLKTIDGVLSENGIAATTGPYLIPKRAPWWARLYATAGTHLIEIVQLLTHTSPHIWGGNVAFRKKDFESIGGYDTSFSFAADELKLRISLQKLGRILHTRSMAVTTSTRRFRKGAYDFFVVFLLKGYILNYISTALFKKPLTHPENLREE